MYHTSTTPFALRIISLLGGEILIFKALPLTDKTSQYVVSQEIAVRHNVMEYGIFRSHEVMYSIQVDGLIETIYRRKYQ